MNYVSKKTLVIVIIGGIILGTIGVLGSYMFGVNSVRGSSLKQYLVTEDVEPGHSLKGKYQEVFVSNNSTVSLSNLVLNVNDIDGSIATVKLYKNSPVTTSSIIKVEDAGRTHEVSFPVSVSGSVANTLRPDDYVAVKLTYKDNEQEDGVVISRIKVKDIRTSNGSPITDDTMVVGFILLDATDSEISDINNALKAGTLYCTKYNNLEEKPLEKTYFVDKSLAEVPAEDAVEPTDGE